MNIPFPGTGLPPNLIPNPPAEMPAIPGPGDAMASLSPFSEPQNVQSIIAQLVLDRPLKLYIPNRERYPEWEFRIINSVPQEIADAHNKGWRQVTDPEFSKLFDDLIAGTDKSGKTYRPLLFSRSVVIGDHIRKQTRMKLASLAAGMDPRNKELQGGGRYAEVILDGNTKGQFSGPAFRIKV